MISINQKKLIRSLHHKKYRNIHHLFLAEGHKIVSDLIETGDLTPDNVHLIAASKEWLDINETHITAFKTLVSEVAVNDMRKITSLMTAPEVIAVVSIPEFKFDPDILRKDYCIVLDSIRDPGNLGNIIRTANWFGVKNIICSDDSVDAYNPKVVQSSMGAILNSHIFYLSLDETFETAKLINLPIYATTIEGRNMYNTVIKRPGILVFGNESVGINRTYERYFTKKINIPGSNREDRIESLNVASAVASVLTECRRKEFIFTQNENSP